MNFRNFFKGDKRTVKAKKNILASIVLKGIDSLVYLLLVPITLGYLNPYEYGVWLTLNSILMWINSFDIGLGNGMRNKLAEAVALNNKELGRIYVSTTFIMLILFMLSIILITTLISPYVNWYSILGTTSKEIPHLQEIVYVTFAIFCLNFIFKFIGNIYLALQLPAINNLIVTSGHLLSLLLILILTKITTGNLMYVALVYSSSPLIIYILIYPITFFKVVPWLRPSLKCFKSCYLSNLFNIGIHFFLLQLSSILLFSFANLLISHLFGPENVTPYNIAYRYFSLVPMCMNIIVGPMWSATTDAYTRGDIAWIKQTMHTIRKILLGTYILLCIMVFISKFIYKIWVGSDIDIPYSLSASIAVYLAIIISSLSYSNFLNGLGKIKLQTINTVTVASLFYPLCWFLGIHFGIIGIIVGMCLLNSSGLVLNKVQFNKVINGTAKGVWNK